MGMPVGDLRDEAPNRRTVAAMHEARSMMASQDTRWISIDELFRKLDEACPGTAPRPSGMEGG